MQEIAAALRRPGKNWKRRCGHPALGAGCWVLAVQRESLDFVQDNKKWLKECEQIPADIRRQFCHLSSTRTAYKCLT